MKRAMKTSITILWRMAYEDHLSPDLIVSYL